MSVASPWIEKWFGAWDLVSRRLLDLPNAPAPQIVFFDSTCVYTTSPVAAHGTPTVSGPKLRGAKLPWHVVAHGGSITLPDSSTTTVQLMSFASSTERTGPFFVMCAPQVWQSVGHPDDNPGLAVFIHEFSHTRQTSGFADRIGPIDKSWPFKEPLDDDVVQKHFGADSVYVAAYLAERDLLYKAAAAPTVEEARTIAKQALEMMRARHAKYFTGDNAMFATLDDVWLCMEGVGQWDAYAWLSHPEGGKMERDAAIKKMVGRGRWWTQDEGLALILAVDRLMPGWPKDEFHVPALGATDLLEKAVGENHAEAH